MKTTRKQFRQFKKSFLKWVKVFGMTGYLIEFQHVFLEDTVCADILVDEPGKAVLVSMAREPCVKTFNPIVEARHESLHLLINRLRYLGSCRWGHPDELNDVGEEIVRRLEKLVSDTKKGL